MPIEKPTPERPRVVRPAPDDLDDALTLPDPDGDDHDESATPGLDDDDEVEAESGTSWLEDDEASELEGDDVDDLEGESSALDDEVVAIDDDPLDVDPEARWSEGSEAEDDLDIGGEDIDPEAAPLGVDDGAEGMTNESDASDGDEETSTVGDRGGDELAGDLPVAEATLAAVALTATDETDSDEPVLALSSLDAEIVLVRATSLKIGRASLTLPLVDETLEGALALDDEHLVVWTSGARAHLFEVHGEALTPLPGEWIHAASDRRGGAWVLDGLGAVRHLVAATSTPERVLLDEQVVGTVLGARRIVAPKNDTALYLLCGEDVLRLANGAVEPIAKASAMGLDGAGALLLASVGPQGSEVVRMSGSTKERLASVDGPVDDLLVVDRALVILSGGRARFVEGRAG